MQQAVGIQHWTMSSCAGAAKRTLARQGQAQAQLAPLALKMRT